MLSEVNVSTHVRQQKKREILLLQKLAFCALGILATICTMDPQATQATDFNFCCLFLTVSLILSLRLPLTG